MERSNIGKACQLAREIDVLYQDLEREAESYSFYDGGQAPFEHTEGYRYNMDEIKMKEKEYRKILASCITETKNN